MDLCKKGHNPTENDIYFYTTKSGKVKNECRICQKKRYEARVLNRSLNSFICKKNHPSSKENTKVVVRKKTQLLVCRLCFFEKKNQGDICKNGHTLKGANVYVTVATDFSLERRCKPCTDAARKRWAATREPQTLT